MNSVILTREVSTVVVLITATLILQSTGMALLIVWGRARFTQKLQRLGPFWGALLMVRITTVMVCLHILEICLWAGFYRWKCLPSWESALYFSAANYSTVGCEDVVLPALWRLLGPCESVAGVLMCGLSASFLFAVVTFLVQQDERFESRTTTNSALSRS